MESDISPETILAKLREILAERYGTASADVHPQVLMDTKRCVERLTAALEATSQQLAVQLEWIDNHDPAFKDDGEYSGDKKLARAALEQAKAALTHCPATSHQPEDT